MDKPLINYIIDIILMITSGLCFATGVLKFPRLLPWFGISYTSLPMNTLSVVHDWSGVLMGVSAIIHIILHWNFIICMTKKYLFKGGQKCER